MWKDKEDTAIATKFYVEKESGVTRTLTQADLGDGKQAVHIRAGPDCGCGFVPKPFNTSPLTF
jgi:hypothetical protein